MLKSEIKTAIEIRAQLSKGSKGIWTKLSKQLSMSEKAIRIFWDDWADPDRHFLYPSRKS